MNFFETFKVAFNSLISNKMRSFLTMLGIIIGVMMIVLLVSVITGSRAKIEGEITSIGSNLFAVVPGNMDMSSGPPGAYTVNKLRLRHLDLLESRSSYGAVACPEYDLMGVVVKYKRESRSSSMVMGTYENMPEVYSWKVKDGNFFKKEDKIANRRVVLIGETIKKDFFPSTSPIDKEISIKGTKFRILGVMESKGNMFGMDMDDIVIMPITTIQNMTGSIDIHQITLKVPDARDVDKAVLETKRILKMEMEEKDFTISSQAEMLDMFNTFADVLSIVTGAIAGISLLVGGIGIMNIMLVTVTERTREIGIRKSVGATFFDIMLQFMVESTAVAVIGSLLAVLFSIGIIALIAPYMPFPLKASVNSIIIAFCFSCFVGIFFGTYPAIKAAKTDPIVALRYE